MEKWGVTSPARLLTFVKEKVKTDFTPLDLRWSIEHHRCLVNSQVERFCSKKVVPGDEVILFPARNPTFTFEKKRVLYEDETLLAYNKPAFISSPEVAELLKLKLIHRLDRDTTGVLLLAKTGHKQKEIIDLFRKRKIHKSYLAWVTGIPKKNHGIIENRVAKVHEREGAATWAVVSHKRGLFAKTEWMVEAREDKYSLLRCYPLTGRTHQIRVHLRYIGLPVVGDVHYGSRLVDPNNYPLHPLLHAEKIIVAGREITAPLPEDFRLKSWAH